MSALTSVTTLSAFALTNLLYRRTEAIPTANPTINPNINIIAKLNQINEISKSFLWERRESNPHPFGAGVLQALVTNQ